MIQKMLDLIYVFFFGKYTLVDFVNKETSSQKCEYILDSVFPDEKTMNIALSANPTSISKSTS